MASPPSSVLGTEFVYKMEQRAENLREVLGLHLQNVEFLHQNYKPAYRGFTDSEASLVALEYELMKHKLKFVIRQSMVHKESAGKILYCTGGIPDYGIPFQVKKSTYKQCQYGPASVRKKKIKEETFLTEIEGGTNANDHDSYHRRNKKRKVTTQLTKKKGCSATCTIRMIKIFPCHQVNVVDGTPWSIRLKKEESTKTLKLKLQNNEPVASILRYWVEISELHNDHPYEEGMLLPMETVHITLDLPLRANIEEVQEFEDHILEERVTIGVCDESGEVSMEDLHDEMTLKNDVALMSAKSLISDKLAYLEDLANSCMDAELLNHVGDNEINNAIHHLQNSIHAPQEDDKFCINIQ